MSEILGTLFKYLVSLLGVAAVVLVLYSVLGSSKTQNAITDMTLLESNVVAFYNGQPYTSLTNAVAIQGKLAPTGMVAPGPGIGLLNPWGGPASVGVNTTGLTDQFQIMTQQIPPDACVKISTSMTNVVGLSVAGGATMTAASGQLPIDAGTAATLCGGSGTPEVDMVLYFGTPH